MPKQFKGKYLVKVNHTKPYDKIDIWNLEVLDIPNPVSPAYRDEVLYAYKDFENIIDTKEFNANLKVSFDDFNNVKWYLITDCIDIYDTLEVLEMFE